MAGKLLFQTNCGASGDMILAAMLDLLGPEESGEFCRTFPQKLGLDLRIESKTIEKNHLKARQLRVLPGQAKNLSHYHEIMDFISGTPLSAEVRRRAAVIFERIFAAEGQVHGRDLQKVHLHELSADDSLVDVIGFCYLWERFSFCEILFTTLITGHGEISTAHGILPVPPPAVVELCRGFRCAYGRIASELLTPTGAAILTSWGRQIDDRESFSLQDCGCGAGERTFADTPNVLRLFRLSGTAHEAFLDDEVSVLTCNLDDMTPEALAHLCDRALAAGALDYFVSPGLMKKGRAGFCLTLLCPPTGEDDLIFLLLAESSTIGVRRRRENRVLLARSQDQVTVQGQQIRIKQSRALDDSILKCKPEAGDLARLAEKLGISWPEALKLVERALEQKHGC